MNELKQQIYSRLTALPPRDRVIALASGVLLLVVLFYLAILLPLDRAVALRATSVSHKRADLAWMQSVAGELQSLSSLQPSAQANGESLVVLIDRSAHESGLGDALTGQTPNGRNSIRVRMDGAVFDSLVLWLAKIQQQYGITVDSASIDRTAKTGVVNASLVLNRAG